MGWSLDGEVAAIFLLGAAWLAWTGLRRGRRAWPWLAGAAFLVACAIQPIESALHEPGSWKPSLAQLYGTLQLVGIGLVIAGLVRSRNATRSSPLLVAGVAIIVVLAIALVGTLIVGLGRLHG